MLHILSTWQCFIIAWSVFSISHLVSKVVKLYVVWSGKKHRKWWGNGWKKSGKFMMASSNGNIFRVTGLLCVEFTGFGVSLFCAWINGDLRRHRVHYNVTVMLWGLGAGHPDEQQAQFWLQNQIFFIFYLYFLVMLKILNKISLIRHHPKWPPTRSVKISPLIQC